MTRCLAALAVLLALAGGTATAAVTVAPGWPRAAPSGTVLAGPGGGVVVVSQGAYAATVRAYRLDGRRRWAQASRFGCGNCDDGPQPPALQPDGTYGPIGVEGDDFWAVDRQGRRVAGCAGVVQRDGTCLTALPDSFPAEPHPGLTVSRAAGRIWRVEDPRWSWYPEFDVPAMAVADGAGRVYAAFFGAVETASRRSAGLLMAVDPVTRTILWTREGPGAALAALPDGVLVADGDGVTAYGADGAPRWHHPTAPSMFLTPAGLAVDPARGRVYVGSSRPGPFAVAALDLATGAERWRTATRDRTRLLSVGRGGRVYVAVDARGRRGIRALRVRDGTAAWQQRTRLPVRGALEFADGRVAVSAGNEFAPTGSDRLTVLVPRPR